MTTKFPKSIYETPDNWGEITIADEARMLETCESLHELGGGFETAELSDCTEMELICNNDEYAVYCEKFSPERSYIYQASDVEGFFEYTKHNRSVIQLDGKTEDDIKSAFAEWLSENNG